MMKHLTGREEENEAREGGTHAQRHGIMQQTLYLEKSKSSAWQNGDNFD